MSPTAGSRGALRERSEASVGELLIAARAAFGEQGYAAATLDDVAGRAGRTKGAIYHHFPNKLALFEAVFVAEQRRLVAVCAEAGAQAGDPLAALEEGFAAYLGAIADPVAGRITLIDAPGALGWERWRTCDDSSFRSLLTATLRQLPVDDVETTADLLLGAVTEVALGLAHARAPRRAVRAKAEHLRGFVRSVLG